MTTYKWKVCHVANQRLNQINSSSACEKHHKSLNDRQELNDRDVTGPAFDNNCYVSLIAKYFGPVNNKDRLQKSNFMTLRDKYIARISNIE